MIKHWKLIAPLIVTLYLPVGAKAKDAVHPKPTSINAISYSTTSAYPNPFKETTTIFYKSLRDEFIKVKLFNDQGQLLSELFEDAVVKGEMYRFELDGDGLLPGVYYYTIETGNNILHQRLELVR